MWQPTLRMSANDASGPFGLTDGQKAIQIDSSKFAYLSQEGIQDDFAQRLPMAERKLVFDVQGESYGPMFSEKLTAAAWKTKPSWVIVSENDRMLQPAMEKAEGPRLHATVTILPTCHLAMLEAPASVATVIEDAAQHAIKP